MGRRGFTLAEVLITLGIIGVVAAMTIPSLIQNQQKQAWVNGLRMAHAKLQEGIRLAMADDQVSDFYATQLYAKCDGKGNVFNYDEDGNRVSSRPECFSEMSKYFKTLGHREGKDTRFDEEGVFIPLDTTGAKCTRGVKNGTHKYYLNDKNKCWGGMNFELTFLNGMTIDMFMSDNGYYYGVIFVDVNGDKGPNTWGRDAFRFYIFADGSLVLNNSSAFAKARSMHEVGDLSKVSEYTWTTMTQSKKDEYCGKNTGIGNSRQGIDCGARIMYDGWKMNY